MDAWADMWSSWKSWWKLFINHLYRRPTSLYARTSLYRLTMNKPKLYLMRGLPASGKSTEAKKLVERGNTVRVNKDLIRTMLHFDKFTGKNEDATVEAEFAVAEQMIKCGYNVVVDDTNLNPRNISAWKYWAEDENHECTPEVIDINTDIGTCLVRDMNREKSVGRDVIIKMALQYCEFLKGEKFILCDLDGTLCDIKHRLNFARGEEKNWKKFFEALPQDTPRVEVLKQLHEAVAETGARIIFVSARPEEYREATEKWFADNGISGHYLLIMRPNHDKRDDTLVKREMFDKYLKNLDIAKVFDDRPRVIAMWRELGLDVVDVGDGIDF